MTSPAASSLDRGAGIPSNRSDWESVRMNSPSGPSSGSSAGKYGDVIFPDRLRATPISRSAPNAGYSPQTPRLGVHTMAALVAEDLTQRCPSRRGIHQLRLLIQRSKLQPAREPPPSVMVMVSSREDA